MNLMEPTRLPALAWFAHIAQHGSFTRAAAQMGVSRAALSQQLKSLERQLGTKLVHRTTRDMSLTEEGRQLFAELLPALSAIDLAVRAVGDAGKKPSGLLRVNTSRVAARILVEPHLVELLGRHPQMRIELVMDDGLANIVADGCDAGIRLGESLAPHVVATPITPMLEMAVVASPAYFERRGVPTSPADLALHDCVAFRHTSSGAVFRWEFQHPGRHGQPFTVEPGGTLVTNDDESMVRMALAGGGLVQHMEIAVRRHIQDGTLVRVLNAWCRPFPGFYLYVPSRERLPGRVRALKEFLVEKCELLATQPREVRAKVDSAGTAVGRRRAGSRG